MTFPDASFDVVLSSGAIMQIEDKQQLFEESLRVLKPGGVLTSYDWMKPEGEIRQRHAVLVQDGAIDLRDEDVCGI